MDEQQLKAAFIQYLQQKSGAQTQQELEAYIQQLGEEGLQKEYAQFMQLIQQQQVAAKRFGGMLNYVGKLRGVCPEGYEMQYFKQGGQICKKCVQKARMEYGGKAPQNPVDAFKCGRKMKKKACGGTMKKKYAIGGKARRPVTGFEDLSYEYEAPYMPNNGANWKAYRPGSETIRSNGKPIYAKDTEYDDEAWLNEGRMQPTDTGYWYSGMDGITDYEPNETTRRAFDSLKRHALMNQQLGRPKFACGGKAKKKR